MVLQQVFGCRSTATKIASGTCLGTWVLSPAAMRMTDKLPLKHSCSYICQSWWPNLVIHYNVQLQQCVQSCSCIVLQSLHVMNFAEVSVPIIAEVLILIPWCLVALARHRAANLHLICWQSTPTCRLLSTAATSAAARHVVIRLQHANINFLLYGSITVPSDL